MKNTKIPFVSRHQQQFQHKFLSEYLWYGILVVLLGFFFLNGIINNGIRFVQSFVRWAPEIHIGNEIELQGTLGKWDISWLMWFKDTHGRQRSLKSNDIDITHYSWEVIIQGLIEWTMIDGTYIIKVNTLYKVLSNNQPQLMTRFLDLWVWLQIDVSSDPNYFIDIDIHNNILIKDIRSFRPVMKIHPFLCDRKQEDLNCGQLIREWDMKKKFDNFISLQSLKYYKINQWIWFVDDKLGKWYHLTVSDDQTMYELSKYIGLLSKDRVSNKIYDRLNTLCSNNEFTMTQSESLDLKQANGNRFAIIKWKSSQWEPIQCELFIDDTSRSTITFELMNILPL